MVAMDGSSTIRVIGGSSTGGAIAGGDSAGVVVGDMYEARCAFFSDGDARSLFLFCDMIALRKS